MPQYPENIKRREKFLETLAKEIQKYHKETGELFACFLDMDKGEVEGEIYFCEGSNLKGFSNMGPGTITFNGLDGYVHWTCH